MSIYIQPDPARQDTLDDLYDRLCAKYCAMLPKTLDIGPDEPPFYAQIFEAVRDEELLGTMTKSDALQVGGYRNCLKMVLFQHVESWTHQIEHAVKQLRRIWECGEPVGVGFVGVSIRLVDIPGANTNSTQYLTLRNRYLRLDRIVKQEEKTYQISATAVYEFGDYEFSVRGGISRLYKSRAVPTTEYCEVLIMERIEEEGRAIAKEYMHGAKFTYHLKAPVEVTEVRTSGNV